MFFLFSFSGVTIYSVYVTLLFLAPSIYENVDIKKGILLQLFGGTRKDFTSSGKGKFRWFSHSVYLSDKFLLLELIRVHFDL